MLNKNFISKSTFNSSLNFETDILIFKLNSLLLGKKFQCLEFSVESPSSSSDDNNYRPHCFNINVILAISNYQNLTMKNMFEINQIYTDWYKYIYGYINHKYIINNFKEDYEYYNNIYNWNFKLMLPFDDDNYIEIVKQTFKTTN